MLHNLPSLFPWKHNKTKIMAEPVLEDINLEEQLEPCGICGRTFLPAPLAKHSRICEKNATKKRKVFNSLKQRVEGTDLAPFHQRTYLKTPSHTQPAPPPPVIATESQKILPKNAWKEKHQQLVNAIRAAKSAPLINKRTAVTASTVGERCPSCDRQFGPKAFDRHVEWCKEKRARLPQSPANIQQAKERLEARIKYRVPPMNKPKRTTVKEKYQSPYRLENLPAVRSTGNLDRKPSIRRSSVNLRKSPEPSPKTDPSPKPSPKTKVVKAETKKVEPLMKSKRTSTLKLNSTLVNCLTSGLTVSHLTGSGLPPKKLVTWRDTYPCNPKIMPPIKKEDVEKLNDEEISKSEDCGSAGSIWNNSSCLHVEERCKGPKETIKSPKRETRFRRIKPKSNINDLTDGIPLKGFVLKQNEDKEFCLTQLEGQKIAILLSPADQSVLGGFPEKVKDNFLILVPRHQVSNEINLDIDQITSSHKLVSDSFTLAECESLPKSEFSDKNYQFLSHTNSCDSLDARTYDCDDCDDLVLCSQDMKVSFNSNETYDVSNREELFADPNEVGDAFDDQTDEAAYEEDWNLEEDFDDRRLMCAGDFVPEKLKPDLMEKHFDNNLAELFQNNLNIDEDKDLVYDIRNVCVQDCKKSPRKKIEKDKLIKNVNNDELDESIVNNELATMSSRSGGDNFDKDNDFKTKVEVLMENVNFCDSDQTSSSAVNDFIVKETMQENIGGFDSEENNVVDQNKHVVQDEIDWKRQIKSTPEFKDDDILVDTNEDKIFHKCLEFKENSQQYIKSDVKHIQSEYNIVNIDSECPKEASKSLSSLPFKNFNKSRELQQECEVEKQPRTTDLAQSERSEIDDENTKQEESEAEQPKIKVAAYKSKVNVEADKSKVNLEGNKPEENIKADKSEVEFTQTDGECDSLNNNDLTNKNKPVKDCKYYPADVIPSISNSVFSFGCEKINFSSSNIIYDKTMTMGDDESFGGLYDDHSVALSRARIERTIRSCCSEINLSAESQECIMNTACSESSIPTRVNVDDDFVVPSIQKKPRKVSSTPRKKNSKTVIEDRRKIKSSSTAMEKKEDVFEPVESKRLKLDEQVEECFKTKSSLLCSAFDKVLNENLEKTRTSRVLKYTKSDCGRLFNFKHTFKDVENIETCDEILKEEEVMLKGTEAINDDTRSINDSQKKVSGREENICKGKIEVNDSKKKVCKVEEIVCKEKMEVNNDVKTENDSERKVCKVEGIICKDKKVIIDDTRRTNDNVKKVCWPEDTICKDKKEINDVTKGVNDKEMKVFKVNDKNYKKKEEVNDDIASVIDNQKQFIEKDKNDDCILKLPPINLQSEEIPVKEVVQERLVLPKIGSKTTVCVQNEEPRSDSYNPLVAAERQLLELLDCDDLKPFKPSNRTPSSQKQTPTKSKHNRASVIDPPSDFQDSVDFELIENFINDNLNDHELLNKLDLDTISITSHKTHYSDQNYNENEIDPRLINEFDNLSIPEHMSNTEDSSPSTDTPEFRTKINSVPPLKQRPKTTPKTQKNSSCSFVRSPSPQRIKNLSTLKRSMNIIDTVKPKNMKNKEDVQNYFHEQETKSPKIPIQQEMETVGVSVAEDLFSVDDAMYEEYKRYEQMYLQEKEEKMRLEQKKNAHSEDENSLNMKISGDSAYGSLSRSKPKVRTKVAKLSPLEPNRLESASSSGSETCVVAQATVSSPQQMSRKGGGGGGGYKMSKFCHECGSKYPVATAKFCVECGVRRLFETELRGNFVARSLKKETELLDFRKKAKSLETIDDDSQIGSNKTT